MDAAVVVFSMFKFFRPDLAESMPDEFERCTALLRGQFLKLERELGGREYFGGAFSRADIALVPHFSAAAFMGLAPGPETPNLAAWLARVSARPSVQRASQEAVACVGQTYERPLFNPNRLHWRSDRLEQLIRVGMGQWLIDELAQDRAFLPPG
jgi:hypothetical protein